MPRCAPSSALTHSKIQSILRTSFYLHEQDAAKAGTCTSADWLGQNPVRMLGGTRTVNLRCRLKAIKEDTASGRIPRQISSGPPRPPDVWRARRRGRSRAEALHGDRLDEFLRCGARDRVKF